MSWRPDNWKELTPINDDFAEERAFEAGADAMLKALREKGISGSYSMDSGSLVFIPSDKENTAK